jgi:thiosulfate dehydrogenase [quinone] large subunit
MSRHATLPLRLYLGATFLYASLDKLSSPHYLAGAGDPASFVAQTRAVSGASPIGPLLDMALKRPTPFALMMAFGELAVGLAALTGLWTRLAAFGGTLISLSLWLTVSWRIHPYYLGNDLAYLLAWTPLLLGGAPSLSLDALLVRQSASDGDENAPDSVIRRRKLLDAGVAALGLSGTGLLAGSLAVRLRPKRASTAPAAGRTAAPSNSAAAGGGPTVQLSRVAVGGAIKTKDPSTGDAVYILQPEQGRYTALSAVCPHAQCVVNPPKDGKLICPCHGSRFDASTGALLVGPATLGLANYEVTEEGGSLRLGAKKS